MTKPLYIFDLDGTLALNEHRHHLIKDPDHPARWDEFSKACVDDLPNKPIIEVLHALIPIADIYIFSGRSALVYEDTLRWLTKNTSLFRIGYRYITLTLRPVGDYTPDEVLKNQWYDALSQTDKDRLICVFDDRQKVVDMWRSIGITCCQVAKGDF